MIIWESNKVFTLADGLCRNLKKIWVLVFSLMYLVSVDPMDRSLNMKNVREKNQDDVGQLYILIYYTNTFNERIHLTWLLIRATTIHKMILRVITTGILP